MQQDFNAAQALLDAEKWQEARIAFDTLLTRMASTRSGRSAAIVKARLAETLLATGETPKAIPLLTEALAAFNPKSPSDREEYTMSMMALGRAYAAQLEFEPAAKAFRAILGDPLFAPGSAVDVALRTSLAQVLIWSDPGESRTLLDGLLGLPAVTWAEHKDQLALLHTLRGRVELNNGNPAAARTWFEKAIKLAGGLSLKVNMADMRVRNDMALASYLLGDQSSMAKYVAYSGGGSLAEEGIVSSAETPLPPCEPRSVLLPDDVAVVEFSIADDGRIFGVTPIYANRGGGPEVLFAQAVKRWSWNAETASKAKGFWRRGIRVELRCTKDVQKRDLIDSSFTPSRLDWLVSKGVVATTVYRGTEAVRLPAMRQELARREAVHGLQSPQLIPALIDLIDNSVLGGVERRDLRRRKVQLLETASAPIELVVDARVDEIIDLAAVNSTSRAQFARKIVERLKPVLAELIAAGAGSSRIANYVRIQDAGYRLDLNDKIGGRQVLSQITATPAPVLSGDDPIRVKALLLLSNLDAAEKNMAGAARNLEQSGLSPDQCALIDVRPQPVNASITERDIPLIARQWTTGGFAKTEYDIETDGTPARVRTVIGMPPFVYGPSTVKSVSRFRFQPVFRPGSATGCVAASNRVTYKIGS